MKRGVKIALAAAGAVAVLILVAVVAGILILRTTWFANEVRQKVVATVERSTGGRVEAPRFRFEWRHLHAEIDNFTLHGLEPAGAPPLLTARRIVMQFRLLSPLQGGINIASLVVDGPRVNVMVFANGTTNIPHPATASNTGQSLQDVVKLAIGHFQVVDGAVTFADRPAAFDARGENLVARFAYNPRRAGYTGDLDISPLVLQSGSRPAVELNLRLPVVIDGDRIAVSNARLANARSAIDFSAEVSHLNAPTGWARVRADVAVADLNRVAGLNLPRARAGAPPRLQAAINASIAPHRVDIRNARVTLGESHVDAEGTLLSSGRLSFDARLALGQIARLLNWRARPEGTADVRGNVELQTQGWVLDGKVEARNFAWIEDGTELRGLDFSAAVNADRRQITLLGLRLAGAPLGPGGSFTGGARVENLHGFQVTGDLRRVDLGLMLRVLVARRLGFAGTVSGPVELQGDFRNIQDLNARAALAIAPGGQGVPVSGRVNLSYNGRADSVTLGASRLQLPHTEIELAGGLNRRIDVRVVSHNLDDLRPLDPLPIQLVNGSATVTAAVTGNLRAPRIQGRAALTNFAAGGRRFSSFSGDVAAAPGGASVSNAVLTSGPLRADFSGSIGLRDWKPEPYKPLRLDATVRNADVADVLALAHQSVPATGTLTADVHLAGTLGSPTGSADVSVANGSIEGAHFDTLAARAVMSPQQIDIPTFSLTAGPSRIEASADYRHAANRLNEGTLHVRVAGNQVQLAHFRPLAPGAWPSNGLAGTLNLNGEISADLMPSPAGTTVQIAGLDGSFAVRNLQREGRNLGDVTANVNTAAGALHYTASSDFAGSTIRVSGQSLLAGDHATTAAIQLANLPLQPALAAAGEDLPLGGVVSASAQVSGTLGDPHVSGTVNVVKGSAWQQPFDRLETGLDYSNTLVNVTGLRVTLGAAYLAGSASLSHAAGDYRQGQIRFRVESSPVQAAQIRPLENAVAGLAGTVQLTAAGAATLRPGLPPLFSALDADLSARGLSVSGQPLGSLTATAQTRGQETVFSMASDFAHANVRGSGRLELAGDYPLSAQVSFTNLTYAALRPFLGGPEGALEAVADGSASLGGPLERPSELHGYVQLSRFEMHSGPPSAGRQARVPLDIRNSGPITASMDHGVLTIQSARLAGSSTQISVSGTVAPGAASAFNVRVSGTIGLQLLEAFDSDLYSSGQVTVAAAITGSLAHPAVNGRLQLSKVSLSLADLPNGISRANGAITFNGTEAVIQNFTGESGGGKVTAGGIVSYGGPHGPDAPHVHGRARVGGISTGRDRRSQRPAHAGGHHGAQRALGRCDRPQRRAAPAIRPGLAADAGGLAGPGGADCGGVAGGHQLRCPYPHRARRTVPDQPGAQPASGSQSYAARHGGVSGDVGPGADYAGAGAVFRSAVCAGPRDDFVFRPQPGQPQPEYRPGNHGAGGGGNGKRHGSDGPPQSYLPFRSTHAVFGPAGAADFQPSTDQRPGAGGAHAGGGPAEFPAGGRLGAVRRRRGAAGDGAAAATVRRDDAADQPAGSGQHHDQYGAGDGDAAAAGFAQRHPDLHPGHCAEQPAGGADAMGHQPAVVGGGAAGYQRLFRPGFLLEETVSLKKPVCFEKAQSGGSVRCRTGAGFAISECEGDH